MRKNLLLKILVIIIACMIWVFHAFLKHHQVVQEIPVNFYNIPEDLIIQQEEDFTIPVNFYGRGMDYLFLKMSNPFILINASNFRYGNNTLKIDEKNLVFPERAKLDVLQIGGSEDFKIFLDRIKSKQVPLDIQYVSAADEEFFLENKILNRDQRIEITGPETVLKSIYSIQTKPVSRKQVRDGKINVELDQSDLRISMEQASVLLDVAQTKIISRNISLIPIDYPLDKNITIIPQKVSVMLSGPKEIVEELTQDSIKAFLDPKDLEKLNLEKPKSVAVGFSLPSGVKLVEYTPQTVQIMKNE